MPFYIIKIRKIKEMSNMGKRCRPMKQIDQESFEKLMIKLSLPKHLVAAYFDCSEDTVEKFIKRTYGQNVTYTQIKNKLALHPDGLGTRSRLHLINESEKGNFYATKVLLKNYAQDIDLSEETHKIEVSTPTDATVKEMEAYFANKETNTGSNME